MVSGACTSCGTGAYTCTSATAASACVSGYSLVGSATTCTKCTGDGAAACTTGAGVTDSCLSATSTVIYSYISATKTCVKCPTGASTCTSTTVATACNNGYVLVGTSCVACLHGT